MKIRKIITMTAAVAIAAIVIPNAASAAEGDTAPAIVEPNAQTGNPPAATGAVGQPANQSGGYDRAGKIQLGVGAGFTLGPRGLSIGAEASYFVTHNISLSPQFSYTALEHESLYMFAAEARYTMDVSGTGTENHIKPWVGAGGGIFIDDADATGPHHTGLTEKDGVLIQTSAGLDYYVTKQFSLGTNISTIFPLGSNVDNFIFRWQVLEAKILF